MSNAIVEQIRPLREKLSKYPPKPESKERCERHMYVSLLFSAMGILLLTPIVYNT